MEVDGYGLGSWKLEAPVEAKKQQKQEARRGGGVKLNSRFLTENKLFP
jgi:hypothetical protein